MAGREQPQQSPQPVKQSSPNLAAQDATLPSKHAADPAIELAKLEESIPVYLPQHSIKLVNGVAKVTVETQDTPNTAFKDWFERRCENASTLPVQVVWKAASGKVSERQAQQEEVLQLTVSEQAVASRAPSPRTQITRTIENTIPEGVRIAKVAFSPGFKKGESLDLVILRIQARDDKTEAVQRWRDKLEKVYGIGVHLQFIQNREEVAETLAAYADGPLLRNLEKLPELAELIHGREPPDFTPEKHGPLPDYDVPDLTWMTQTAIDPPGIKDPEDITKHYLLPDGNVLLIRSVVLNMRLQPGNEWAEWGATAWNSLYGNHCSVPLFGDEWAWTEGAFVPGEPRYAAVCSMIVNPDNEIVDYDASLARVMSHRQMSFPEADEILEGKKDPLSKELKSLAHIVERIKNARSSEPGFVGKGDLSSAYDIVSQTSILGHEVFAAAMKAEGVKILHRVHTRPKPEIVLELFTRVRDLGIPVRLGDFEEPQAFRQLLSRLQAGGNEALMHQILDVFFVRSHYEIADWGHEYLKKDDYAPIKARTPGWVNQLQFIAHELGTKGFSAEELRELQHKANAAKHNEDLNTTKIFTFSELLKHRTDRGTEHIGTVTAVSKDEIHLEVPGYRKDVIVRLPQELTDEGLYTIGKQVAVKMDAYHIYRDRFIFDFVEEPA